MIKALLAKKTWAAVGALALAGMTATGSAVAVSPNSNWLLIRNNTAGTTFTNMSASATTFCYLSGFQVTETDTGAETARCRITRGPIVWTLEAILGASSDADIQCNATCYNN